MLLLITVLLLDEINDIILLLEFTFNLEMPFLPYW